jgi:peptide/nickel transport system permease protein
MGGHLSKSLLGSPTAAAGTVLVTLVLAVALFAPWVAPHGPNAIDVTARLESPSLAHWLGTDNLGRDFLSRLIYGTRVAMGVSLSVILISLSTGIVLGVTAAYSPRPVDLAFLAVFDIVSSYPPLILALGLVAVLGPGLGNIILLISLVKVPHFARVARAQTIATKNSLFLEAEQVLGAPFHRVLLRHVLPNIIGPIFVLACMDIPTVITLEAGLSFLGIGIRPPFASWGSLLNDGFTFLNQSAWLAVFSGLALLLATLGFSLFGEALRDALDPRLQQDR